MKKKNSLFHETIYFNTIKSANFLPFKTSKIISLLFITKFKLLLLEKNNNNFLFLFFQIIAIGNFELQILEISNTNSHILSGYCCGVPLEIRHTKTTGE